MDMRTVTVLFAMSLVAGIAAFIHSGLAVGLVVAVVCVLLTMIVILLMVIAHELRTVQKKL